ncbi:hypothetical protein LCGC14_1099800 [marine sediment metagenome]|uniref:Uncharacterized protein n=1 Tax=marine sediment metagenome TaxID=412755 RepID=A0A0F9QFZ2_9ZZZZ
MFFDEIWNKPVLNNLLGSKPWMVFDNDDGSKDDGSKDDGGGGGGSKDDGGKKDDTPATFDIKVSGVDKTVTLDEMKEMATKAGGADEKFREAAQKLKDAEDATSAGAEGKEIKELFGKLFTSGEYNKTDIRRFGELTGQGAEEMEKMFAAELEKQGKTSAGAKGDDTPFRKLTAEDLAPDLQETLAGAKQTQVEQAEIKIAGMVEKGVDKDDFFGTIIKDTEEKQQESRKTAITDMVKREVNKRILSSPYTNEKFGDAMIKGAIQEIRANIKAYGVPTKASEQPVSSVLAGLGLSGDLLTKVQDNETIERVSAGEEDYLDNFVARLAQKQAME